MKHVLFQWVAIISSFGMPGAGKKRPTWDRPSKSAVNGFLGACLGKPREDPWHALASESLGFASLELEAGLPFSDYHTIRPPAGDGPFNTRREELLEAGSAVLTERDYLTGGAWVICLWPKKDGIELESLMEGLLQPVWAPYIGRKCCSLSLPPNPVIVNAPSLRAAFQTYKERIWPDLLKPADHVYRVFYEDHGSPDLSGLLRSESRIDRVIDLSRRQMASRTENRADFKFS